MRDTLDKCKVLLKDAEVCSHGKAPDISGPVRAVVGGDGISFFHLQSK